ncbi:FAD-dependent monooxygenase [Streptomyces sp. Tue6028]|uniref:FAD-dependent monooxygenase n=1 Tax=Streptomyces sp. Tue6028 TaxID=2036037 RepID=UPI003D70CF5E
MSGHAVVVGGSVAGLLAAAALSQSVDVTVLERDELPEGPLPRKGIPQSRHAHILLPSGRAAIEELLPAAHLRKRLLAAGAREESLTAMLGLGPRGWFRRWQPITDELLLTCCSRDLLDSALREAVLGTPRITLRRAQAVALLGTSQRVTGVRVSEDGEEEDVSADLVVDASGRGSRIEHWLSELGVGPIPADEVDSGLVYASRVFRIPEGAETFPLTQVGADPVGSQPARSGNLVPIEDGQWLVSLGGTRGGEPTDKPAEFTRFAHDLRHPLIGQLISAAEPISGVSLSRSTRNRRRDFHKAAMPEGVVVLGDAAATYNPVYGQGMSVAALSAQALQRQAQQTGITAPGFARRVQQAAAKWVTAAYTLSTSQDQWVPGVVGKTPTRLDRVLSRYMSRMALVATTSYRVSAAMCAVTTLQADASRLVHPRLLLATANGPVLPPLEGPQLTQAERDFLSSAEPAASS